MQEPNRTDTGQTATATATPELTPIPRPWQAQFTTGDGHDFAVGTIWGDRDGKPAIVATLTGRRDEVEPHGRLIAAAPDLAEALRPFAVYYEWLLCLQPFDDPNPPPPETMVCRLVSPGGTIGITFGDLKSALAAIDKAGINPA